MNKNMPFKIGNVEVQIESEIKFISFAIKLNCEPQEVATPAMLDYMKHRVSDITNYLVAEGFIPDPKTDPEWQFCIGGTVAN